MQALTLTLALALGAQTLPPATPRAEIAAADARLREETVQSTSLGRSMRYRVLLPDDYGQALRRYPVLYLLHGLEGDYRDWTTRANLARHAAGLPLVIVTPDAGNGWYTNSAGEPAAKFEDYVLVDLIADVERKYDVIRSRYGRAIAGLSMGGFGAVKMALKRPNLFFFAASFSGAHPVARDPDFGSRFGKEFERMQQIFGPADSETRRANDVYLLASKASHAAVPYFYLDCGTGDFLLHANRELAATFERAKIAYEYHEYPGGHSWNYWDARIQDVLPLLMRRFDLAASAGR